MTVTDSSSPLVDHARRELTLAGLFDEDSDYDGMLGQAVMAVVEAFADPRWGHSGGSAAVVIDLATRLMRYEGLTELTDDPAEWMDRSEMSGYPLWQNVRDCRMMSTDGGKSYYNVDGITTVIMTSKPHATRA